MDINKKQKKTLALGCFIILSIVLLIAILLPMSNLIFETDTIAIIPIEGEINYNSNINQNNSTDINTIENKINQANTDDNVKAIVFDINSGGGSLAGSEEIANLIKQCSKPTVSYIGDKSLCESYLIATSSDEIIANPSAAIGGIGLNFYNSSKYSNIKINGEFEEDYTNQSTIENNLKKININQSFNPNNLANSQEMINQDYSHFISLIGTNRNLNDTYIAEMGYGKIYNGYEAKNLKLIDNIGTKNKAIEIASLKANITNYQTVKYLNENYNSENLNHNTKSINKYFLKDPEKVNNTYEYLNNLKTKLTKN